MPPRRAWALLERGPPLREDGDGDCPQPLAQCSMIWDIVHPPGRATAVTVNLQSPRPLGAGPRLDWGGGPQEACGWQALSGRAVRRACLIYHRPTSWSGLVGGACLETRGVNYRTELTSLLPSSACPTQSPALRMPWRQA